MSVDRSLIQKTQSFFVSLGIQDQLKALLKDTSVVDSIFSYRFNRSKESHDSIDDIYDGNEYQKHFQGGILSNPHNFSLSFNTDGMPIGKSSKKRCGQFISQSMNCPLKIGRNMSF